MFILILYPVLSQIIYFKFSTYMNEYVLSLTKKYQGKRWCCKNEELISKTSYIQSYMLLICISGHSKEANFQYKRYCK